MHGFSRGGCGACVISLACALERENGVAEVGPGRCKLMGVLPGWGNAVPASFCGGTRAVVPSTGDGGFSAGAVDALCASCRLRPEGALVGRL